MALLSLMEASGDAEAIAEQKAKVNKLFTRCLVVPLQGLEIVRFFRLFASCRVFGQRICVVCGEMRMGSRITMTRLAHDMA